MSNNNLTIISYYAQSQTTPYIPHLTQAVCGGVGGGAGGLGATMLSISQMCKPYALTEIKTKKKQWNMKGIFNFVKTVNSRYR